MNNHYPTWQEQERSYFLTNKRFPKLNRETPTFFGVPAAYTQDDLKGADFVIIGAPFVSGEDEELFNVPRKEWLAVAQRIRQQSVRYVSGYLVDHNIDIFEHVKIVDYGDAVMPVDANDNPTSIEVILGAQAAVETKVKHALDAGAIPIVFGGFAPCSAYAIVKPLAEKTMGKVGMVCLDAHWDSQKLDVESQDHRIAGAGNWKNFMYQSHANCDPSRLVEIGERGMLEEATIIREYLELGATFISAWKLKGELGINGAVNLLPNAFKDTEAVFAHLDLDVLGGSGPMHGDLLGELAEPMGLTDYDVIRIAYEIGKLGTNALSFASIVPNSPIMLRMVVYSIIYFIAGHIEGKK